MSTSVPFSLFSDGGCNVMGHLMVSCLLHHDRLHPQTGSQHSLLELPYQASCHSKETNNWPNIHPNYLENFTLESKYPHHPKP